MPQYLMHLGATIQDDPVAAISKVALQLELPLQ